MGEKGEAGRSARRDAAGTDPATGASDDAGKEKASRGPSDERLVRRYLDESGRLTLYPSKPARKLLVLESLLSARLAMHILN